jgi:hypothetical protein
MNKDKLRRAFSGLVIRVLRHLRRHYCVLPIPSPRRAELDRRRSRRARERFIREIESLEREAEKVRVMFIDDESAEHHG